MANLNANSHFSQAPHAHIERSIIPMSFSHKLTTDVGMLTPVFCKEILPGDSFEVHTSMLARLQTLMTPIMDDLYMDYYTFFVPNRLLWKNWERFCGESDEPWFDETVYSVPKIAVNVGSREGTQCVGLGTVADHLGMPLANSSEMPGVPYATRIKEFSHLPFRAYCRVWNDWFRDQVTQGLTPFNTEDDTVTMNNLGTAWFGGALLPVNKYRDYFTSCQPEPQKGPSVTIGVGDTAPVYTSALDHDRADMKQGLNSIPNLHFTHSVDGTAPYFSDGAYQVYGTYKDADTLNARAKADSTLSGNAGIAPSNLFADISSVSGISINELRIAFATQQFYERMALSGSRYIEILESMFGVTSPDSRLQRSEYLGGNRIALSINQVVQNSETNSTPLGNLGAYSLTTDNQFTFHHSFVEHGFIIGVCCIRYKHSYQDGYERMWNRFDKEDFYWPIYKNIGAQPVLNQEIKCTGLAADTGVFGYQEAWADYRYAKDYVTGEFHSGISNTLESWHLADDYTTLPSLSGEWMMEDPSRINRVVAVSDRLANPVLADFHISMQATRPMPVYSVPGLDIL